MTVIEGQVGAVLAQCFALLKAMSEVESMVRVLQLVTVVVEVAGNSAQPYLGAFAAALPEVRKTMGRKHLLTANSEKSVECSTWVSLLQRCQR